MLSEDAIYVAIVLRDMVAPDEQGVGPSVPQLLAAVDLDAEQLRDALNELTPVGFVRTNPCLGLGPSNTRALAGIRSVTVLGPMQRYLNALH